MEVTTSTRWSSYQAEEDISTLRGDLHRLSEYLEVGSNPDVAPPDAGNTALFCSGGQPNYIGASGLTMGLMGSQNATFPNTTVTAASLTNLATATIPANDAEIGAVYELEVWGDATQGSTKQTLKMGVALGGTALQAFVYGTTAFSGVSVGFRWVAKARVICITTGASATWQSYIWGTETETVANASPGNASTTPAFACEGSATTTKDSTVDQTLAVQAAWGATTGAPTMTSRVAMFKRIA